MRKVFVTVLVAVALVIFGAKGYASTFYLQGVENPDVTATVDFYYAGTSSGTGQVMIGINNTSSESAVLTAFAFNLPTNITGAEFIWAPDHWTLDLDLDGVNTPGKFGLFDLAAITGPNFNGGSPNFGITNGNSGQFVIKFTGTDMFALTENSFLSILSAMEKGGNIDPQFAIARFQRVGCNGGSDVAIPTDPGNPVPEPTTMILLGTGLIGLIKTSRKKKK